MFDCLESFIMARYEMVVDAVIIVALDDDDEEDCTVWAGVSCAASIKLNSEEV